MVHPRLNWVFVIVLILFVGITAIFPVACTSTGAESGQAGTVPGPESNKLVRATTGFVVFERPYGGGISAVELPSLRETTVIPDPPADTSDRPTIHAISGPDDQGRLAYIEDHFFVADKKDRRHLLKTAWIDGSHDTAMFTRPGDAMWATSAAGHGEIGRHIALSPTGGRVAFLSATSDVQMPGALYIAGSVEIWDVAKKTGNKTNIRAIDDGLAWFPDGKKLAYVKFVEFKAVPPRDEADPFGQWFDKWDKLPAVYIRDVDAGTERFLHVGASPVVSSDGAKALVYDCYSNYKLVDIATGKATAAKPPGEVFALSDHGVVLTRTSPTAGAKLRYTDNNSPLSGPKLILALKLFSLDTSEFQTVVPYIDPRLKVSFGRINNFPSGGHRTQ